MNRDKKRDMTRGPVLPTLIFFTVPLILGNLLQLLYNAADSVIAGNYIGSAALAAIGAAAPIMNLAVLFISGMCLGTGILISVEYGSGDQARMERQLSTILITGIVFSVAVSAVMIPLAGPVLRLTRVDESVLPLARQYLQVIFIGLIFTFLYNFLASALRALGDSRTPLIFLGISSVINILGDLLCVRVLQMGVLGSAVATVFSQAVSVILCVLYIRARIPALNLGRKWFRFDRSLLGSTLGYGFTSAMQQACLQLGKVLIQSEVNSMGVAAAAAFTVVNRVDDFAYTPEQNIAHGAHGPGARGLPQGTASGIRLRPVPGRGDAALFHAHRFPLCQQGGSDARGGRHRGCALCHPDQPHVPSARPHKRRAGLVPGDGRDEDHAAFYLYQRAWTGDRGDLDRPGGRPDLGFCLGQFCRLASDDGGRAAHPPARAPQEGGVRGGAGFLFFRRRAKAAGGPAPARIP